MSLVPLPSARDIPAEVETATPLLVGAAEMLAAECFRGASVGHSAWVSDPETGERWVELRLTVAGSPEAVADAYDEYVARWVAPIPWPQHNWVRLSYTIG